MKFINRLRIGKLFVQLVFNPKNTELIFEGVRIVSADGDDKLFKEIETTYLSSQDFLDLYESRYNPVPPKLEKLKSYAPGTFGRALYQHLSDHNLSLEIFPRFEFHRPIEFLSLRAYQDHDLWHVLLGRSVEIEDELAVQAFGVAQYGSPVASLLIAGGLLHLLWKSPMRAAKALEGISANYQLGKRAKLLVGLKLQDLFDLPLPEARRFCGLEIGVTN